MSNSTYIRHSAFNKVYEKIVYSPRIRIDGFEAAKKYHHDPIKLEKFNDFSKYLAWANELYQVSTDQINHFQKIYDQANRESSSFYSYNSEASLKNV